MSAHDMAKKKDPLLSVLTEIDAVLKRQNSLGYIFLQGLMRGFGTAFGATVLVVTSITIHFADTPQVAEFMRSVINSMVE